MKAKSSMQRFPYEIALLLLAVLIASGCVVGPSALSQRQLQEYLRQRNIQPLATENVGGVMTVILFKNAREMGCNVVFARNGIETISIGSPLQDPQNNIYPVSYGYDAILGYEIFCLSINDANIKRSAKTIKIILSSGNTITEEVRNQGDMIIHRSSDTHSRRFNIIIYNEAQEEVFRLN